MQKDPPSTQSSEPPVKNLDEPIVINKEGSAKVGVPHLKRFHRMFWSKWTKRQKIIVSSCVVAGIAILVIGLALIEHKPVKRIARSAPAHVLKTVASPLTGVQVAPELAARPVTGIMIENSTLARPQAGLQDAGVVYEAIAEAGITRFLALYQEARPGYIGPVRSLRPYYIDFAAPYQASIAHVGGSPDALAIVRSGPYRDLDQFFNAGTYFRVPSRDAPHNVYTTFDLLDNLNQAKGYTSSTFTPWPRKADKKLENPSVRTIDISISSPDYYAHYGYDPATNSYARSEGGSPHMEQVNSSDSSGSVQIKPKVVIALVMPQSQGALDASGAYYTNYADSGTGQMFLFEDGGWTPGTWDKTSTTDMLKFTDNNGKPVKLDAGQTWITIVGNPSQVAFAP